MCKICINLYYCGGKTRPASPLPTGLRFMSRRDMLAIQAIRKQSNDHVTFFLIQDVCCVRVLRTRTTMLLGPACRQKKRCLD